MMYISINICSTQKVSKYITGKDDQSHFTHGISKNGSQPYKMKSKTITITYLTFGNGLDAF